MRSDWFGLGANRSAKGHGYLVDRHHVCSEEDLFLSFILRTPGKFPKEHRLHSEHGESLKTTNSSFRLIVERECVLFIVTSLIGQILTSSGKEGYSTFDGVYTCS